MAIVFDFIVPKNGSYVLHDRSYQKLQFLLTLKLPKMATICFMAEMAICIDLKVAKNGNYLLYARSGDCIL